MERVRHFADFWRGLDPRRKMLAWALAIGLFAGWSDIGVPLDNGLWALRNRVATRPASGEIVVVGVDDKSIAEIGQWPWRRSVHAQLLDRIAAAKAKHVYFDLTFRSASTSADDKAFTAALTRAQGKVSLITFRSVDPMTKEPTEIMPYAPFAAKSDWSTRIWK